MALVPRFVCASTRDVAEACLRQGIISNPSICYIKDGNYLLFVTKDNTLDFVSGYNQITDIKSLDGVLYFMTGDDVIYTADAAITPDILERVKDDVANAISLDEYAKNKDVVALLDGRIGDLEGKDTVRNFIDNLSYNSISDVPITNLYGSLTKTIVVADLDDGVYKIKGQYKLGGNHQTIQLSTDDVFFIVAHNHTNSTIIITQLMGNQIRIYTIGSDGTFISDKYITESYINQQDFIKSKEVKDYVKSLVTDAITETIDAVLDERLDVALDNKLSNIDDQTIISLF